MAVILQETVQSIFDSSLTTFLGREVQEILEGVNERNNCGRWSQYLEAAALQHGLEGYVADPEYNRKQDGRIKTILDDRHEVVTINCDLILHTRGNDIANDNLIAIEVKKSERPAEEKESDRRRLRALTKSSYDDVWMNDGTMPPEHVCGYRLGAYVELDRESRICFVEFYREGHHFESRNVAF
jgi:hypothetical protein